ncbi:MAG TPA: hypothetical protein VHL10_09530 [Nitrososphaera sp.]|nr:hypothetical protein [Nitrososphaera sp.]
MTQTSFDPNNHLIQLKSKAGSQDYLPVQFRLVWFRMACPEGTIETEEVLVDLDREIETEAYVWNAEKRRSEKIIKQAKGYARYRAIVTDGKGGRATATGSESAVDFPDFCEKAETKAVGRALAMLGYGTQFAPEFGEQHRIVDAPVDHQDMASTNSTSPRAEAPASTRQTPPANQKPASPAPAPRNLRPSAPKPAPQQSEQAKATDQQKSSIQKLCEHVQMSVPEDLDSMSQQEAKTLIAELTAEYKKQRSENQPAPAQPKITPQQAERIRNLCKALGENEPEGLAEMAYFEAKKLYESLTAKYKAQKQATPQVANQDNAPIQDKATAAMVNKAKSRAEALDMLWGDIKRDALGNQVDDKDITVAQYAKISSVIETYEQKKAS